MDDELLAEIDDLRERGLYRQLRRVDSAPGPRVILDGREVIVFGSNNYLGLSTHPKVVEAAVNATRHWGAGSSGSRLTTGNLSLHEGLERDIAEFKGTEAALVYGTGYMAGVGAISTLAAPGDLILSNSLNHACLIDGCRLSRADTRVYRHCDIDHVRELLADRSRYRRCLIVTDSVFSMDGDIAPLPELVQLANEFDAWLLVDDAHGTGVLGSTGRGTLEHCEMQTHSTSSEGIAASPPTGKVVMMGTLSKALGAEGGFIAGSRVLIDYLINRSRPFIFSTAPAPASLAAARAALTLVDEEPERRDALKANGDRLRAGLRAAGFDIPDGITPIIPVIFRDDSLPFREGQGVGSNSAYAATFASTLLDNGIYAPAIRPPTVPEGTGRLRMSVMSTHTADDIDTAVEAMVKTKALVERTADN